MSAKLIVQKFDTGTNFKSLQINIEDSDNGVSEITFGEWTEGKNQNKTKDEKPSRLIVKIVSGGGYSSLNLDSCSKPIDNPDIYNDDEAKISTSRNNFNLFCYEVNSNDKSSLSTEPFTSSQDNDRISFSEETLRVNSQSEQRLNLTLNCQQDSANITFNDLTDSSASLLEYSLEKVKENNARIMENIHMLNRTLNYTKKKEILDIVCPKSLRFPCNNCGKCFVYETGLKRHYSMRHSLSEMQPRWQVVWTCIECFQVWPRQDLAIKHATQCCRSNTTDCVREIKTSSLLQCEFCEKVYTSIPRLLRHSKIHITANNYECNVCESTFVSFKAAEQHWLLCPWLKMCYNFSLPKMLLCNACDRKFKNYEQLYNHRYKVGHFMTKTHCNKESVKSLRILVYQCEICAQWFPAIPSLQNHRSQHRTVYDSIMQCNENYDYNCYETAEIDYQVNHLDNQQYLK